MCIVGTNISRHQKHLIQKSSEFSPGTLSQSSLLQKASTDCHYSLTTANHGSILFCQRCHFHTADICLEWNPQITSIEIKKGPCQGFPLCSVNGLYSLCRCVVFLNFFRLSQVSSGQSCRKAEITGGCQVASATNAAVIAWTFASLSHTACGRSRSGGIGNGTTCAYGAATAWTLAHAGTCATTCPGATSANGTACAGAARAGNGGGSSIWDCGSADATACARACGAATTCACGGTAWARAHAGTCATTCPGATSASGTACAGAARAGNGGGSGIWDCGYADATAFARVCGAATTCARGTAWTRAHAGTTTCPGATSASGTACACARSAGTSEITQHTEFSQRFLSLRPC